jgi:cytochrome b pre-mRNA-processing protein 3
LNPLNPLFARRRKATSAAKLYGAIVAQTRLPFFYQEFGVPDTLEGRFVLLSLHLFAVLHRFKTEGTVAHDLGAGNLAQELVDRFSEDMKTVLRELGVSDLRIPKNVRGLAASSGAWLHSL